MVAAAGGLPAEVTANWRTLDIGTVDVEFGFSCMGYEISGAWGARIAQAEREPDQDTIVFIGDGSYMMMNSDIYSSVLTGKKLIVLVEAFCGQQLLQISMESKLKDTKATLKRIDGFLGQVEPSCSVKE